MITVITIRGYEFRKTVMSTAAVVALAVGALWPHPAVAQSGGAANPGDVLAPLLDSQTIGVGRLDLARVDPAGIMGLFRQMVGSAADEADTRRLAEAQTALIDAKETFQAAGISTLYAGLSLANPTQLIHWATAPLSDEAKAQQAVERIRPWLEKHGLAAEARGWRVVIAQAASLERLQQPSASARPDLIEPLQAAPAAALLVVISPSAAHRRALRETLPPLPDFLGGGPTSHLADGVRWVRLVIDGPPQLRVNLIVQARDAHIASELHSLAVRALEWVGQQPPAAALLGPQVRPLLTPDVQGDQLVLDWSDPNRMQQVLDRFLKPSFLAAFLKARSAAHQVQTTNNLKQIGLAMHNYHDTYGRFPPQAIRSKDGKPLLSWRVALLPFLEQNDLYRQFRLDEPWDSEHNRRLLQNMPAVYVDPHLPAGRLEPGLTTFLVPLTRQPPAIHVPLDEKQRRQPTRTPQPREPVAPFDVPEGTPFQWITDGSSNTILVVRVAPAAAVPWTKPEDWVLDDAQPLKNLGSVENGRGPVAFGDGSVRVLPENLAARVFRLLVLMNDGQPVGDF